VILFAYHKNNNDTDLEVSDTCVRNSVLSWVEITANTIWLFNGKVD